MTITSEWFSWRRPVLVWIGAVTVAALVVIPDALAAWSGDPVVNAPVCVTSGDQEFPQVIADGQGGYFVAWEDGRTLEDSTDIYAQHLSAAGDPLWAPNGVPVCRAPGAQWLHLDSCLAPDSSGGVYVAWTDYRGTDPHVYAQRLDDSGAPLWTEDGIPASTATAQQIDTCVLPDGAGGLVLTWSEVRPSEHGIFAQHLDGKGNALWGTEGTPVCISLIPQFESILSDGQGGWFVVWQDYRDAPADNGDIYAQRIDHDGQPEWAVNGVPVDTSGSQQGHPDLCSDGAGGILVTWEDDRSGDWGIYGQRLSPSGERLWSVTSVPIGDVPGNQLSASLVPDGEGGAIATWYDQRHAGCTPGCAAPTEIYAQEFTGSGQTLWADGGVQIRAGSTSNGIPMIASDGAGGAYICWADGRDPTGIYAQRLGPDGNARWAANGIALGVAANSQNFPRLATDASGSLVVTWRDRRSDTGDIYAERVDSSGVVGSTVDVPASPSSLRLEWAGSNPALGMLRVSFSLPDSRPAHLELYDVSGRKLLVREIGSMGPGPHVLRLPETSRLSSGVYWLRLVHPERTLIARAALIR